MKLETRLIAIVALVWASLALVGLVFAGVAYKRAQERLFSLEAEDVRLDHEIRHSQPVPATAEHITK